MLVAKGLDKKYGTLAVVNNVSLEVKQGEVISIIGPSGAGKSTLLHLIGSLDKPDRGSVTINGTDIFRLPSKKQAQFRNRHMGFVFQAHHLLPEFSAIENVSIPLWISGIDRKKAMDQAAAMLETVGLGNRLENKPSELSGGEQQRVAIARALVNKPSVVMADEPTGDTLTLSASGSATGAVYVWSGPNNFSAAQQQVSVAPATAANAGTYLIVAVANGCMSAPGGTNVSISNSTLAPTVSISANPGTVIAAGTQVSFTAATNLGAGALFQWRKNGQPVAGATASTWSTNTLVNGDMVDVIAGSNGPCIYPDADTSNALVMTLKSGVESITGNMSAIVYPNPNNGDFTVSGTVPSGVAVVEISDAPGRILLRENYTVQNNLLHQSVHLPGISPGMYYLRITSGAGSETLAFTVR